MTLAESTSAPVDALDRLAAHLPGPPPVRRGLVAGLRAAVGLRPRRWRRLAACAVGSIAAVLLVRTVLARLATSSDAPSPADVLPEPPEGTTSPHRSVAASSTPAASSSHAASLPATSSRPTGTPAAADVPADDEVLDLDTAALILGTPPEQVRTMLADGLLVAEDPAAPTFRAAAVRAVRLAGG